MDDVFRVKVLNAFNYFIDENIDEFRVQSMLILFDKIEQIALEVLKNEVDFSFLLEGLLDTHHIISLQHFQHFYLSLDRFA
jgi:hypothetical protein